MTGKYLIPKDVPAAACGRCMWFTPIYKDGWGRCLVKNERFYYKCMVCAEYDFDPTAEIEK